MTKYSESRRAGAAALDAPPGRRLSARRCYGANRAASAWLAALATVALAAAGCAAETLSYADLVKRMADLERLAVLPAPGETCRQWSSGDRRSVYNAEKRVYEHWDANDDGNGLIRTEGDLEVMAEMAGPGCITRMWSAQALDGHVRITIDGQKQPAVDLPFRDYFTGKTAPFGYPQLSYDLADGGSQGRNLYFPIPYQTSCKIVAEKGWGRYYQIVYTTFPQGTTVPSFSTELAARHADALEALNAHLRDGLGSDPAGPRQGQQVTGTTLRVEPGTSSGLELTGPQAITALRVRMAFASREDGMVALRRLVLRIAFDGESQASVWCPLGDFFGTAPGVNAYRSLATGMLEDGAYAYWYMPFAASARVELANEDSVARAVAFEVVHAPLARPFAGLGHFHCKWHRDTRPLPPDRWPDWLLLETTGRGRFCGVMLHVWNPYSGWWGEGDEKFLVDGEGFPSTFGTGSEDYFGYAWCSPALFARPFHCQTMSEDNRGHQALLRWQIADNVPFQTSFEGCIEKYCRSSERGTEYASTVCWYLAPGGEDPYGPLPVETRHGYYTKPPLRVAGFTVLDYTNGFVLTQEIDDPKTSKWTNGDHLLWAGTKPGDRLDLAVPVANTGTYPLAAVFTKTFDYGIFQLYLDGSKVGPPLDLYSPTFLRTEPIPLGTHDLTAGEHRLTVELLGANDKATRNYVFAMDCVTLETPK